MASFVRVPKHLLNLPANFKRGIIKGGKAAESSIKNGVRDSILKRWHNTGASAGAITSELTELENNNIRVVIKSGQFYDVFGEYGTGTRGEENAPSFKPNDWNYGEKAGIAPRMAFHLGAEEALPEVLTDLAEAIVGEMND